MTNFVNDKRRSQPGRSESAGVSRDGSSFLFDTKSIFEKWLKLVGRDSSVNTGALDPEVTFEGELRVDGVWRSNIRSSFGTLVMTEQGRVEADIDVRVALINGYFDGTLRASEQVVLERNARVFGNILTPSLSIRDGAFFDGNSVVLIKSS